MGETMMRMMIVIVNTLTKALFLLSIYLYLYFLGWNAFTCVLQMVSNAFEVPSV